MTEYNIFRPLTQGEKVDTIPLGTKNLLNIFIKELASVQSEYTKSRRPFDAYSARLDFDNNVRNQISELSNTIDENLKNKEIDFGDLHKYGNYDRFTFIEGTDCMGHRVVAGVKTEIVTGKRYKFICKQRGNKISILVPIGISINDGLKDIEEFEKWLNDEFLGKGKKEVVEDTKNEVKETKESTKEDKE